MNYPTATIAEPISGTLENHEVDADIDPWFAMGFHVDVHWAIDSGDDPEVEITDVTLKHIALHDHGDYMNNFPTWFIASLEAQLKDQVDADDDLKFQIMDTNR